MKKLFYYTPYSYPDNNAAAIRNEAFINILSKHFDINIYTGSKTNKYISLLFRNPSNRSHFLIRLLKEIICGLELFLRIFISKSDIYFFSSPPYFTIFIAVLACNLRNKKYILDIRDLYPEVFFNVNLIKKDSTIGFIITSFTNFIYNQSILITTVTDGLVETLKSITRTKVILIRNGYDQNLFNFQQFKKFDNLSCVFHGTLGSFQDIELLSEIIQKVEIINPSIHFYIIGDGPKKEIINALKSSNYTYHKRMNFNEIPSFISKCHIGLSFRVNNKITTDSFPVKVYEYIGVGLPIISTPVNCEAGNFIENYQIGYNFEPTDSELLINKILELNQDLELRKNLESNIKKVRKEFTRQIQAEKLLEELLKL